MANIKEVTAAGKTVEEAKENARLALGLDPLAEVNYTIIDLGKKGLFGTSIGARAAQVKAWIELPEAEERHRRKSERPKRERPERREGADRAAERAEGVEASAEKKSGKKHKHKRADAQKSEKPKSAVIPETDLKLEPKLVGEGEDMSFDFVKTLISDIGLSAEAMLYTCEDGTRRIVIAGDDASVLIGHHGDTLDALQYLANLASARKNINGERDKSRVTIDIEGYRAKREETLRALARRMAAKALRQRRSVMLEPMSAYERRIIHSEIQGIEGVSTNSIGQDSNRKIVIYLTDKKPKEIFENETAEESATVTAAEEAAVEAMAADESAAAVETEESEEA